MRQVSGNVVVVRAYVSTGSEREVNILAEKSTDLLISCMGL